MPYTIAILSKYPPLEGGIAAKTYWLARGLANRGHTVHVITHRCSAGREYRIPGNESHLAAIPNLWVHRPQGEMPWHTPEDDEYTLALLDLTISVAQEHAVQILDTGYLVPYGSIGHLAKRSTGMCHVIRHGGSDLEKFLKMNILKTVLNEAISHADVVITDERHKDLFEPLTSRLVFQPAYVPDRAAFTESDGPRPQWRLGAIGKVNYYWQHKGLHFIAEIMRRLTGQFDCWIVSQGIGMSDFQLSLDSETVSSLSWRPFVFPWEMPQLLNKLDAIFIFESGLPNPVTSNLALEAMCSGVGIITDRADFARTYHELVEIGKNEILMVQPFEPAIAAEMITQWVQERAHSACPPRQLISYEQYLCANEVVYEDLLNSRQS